MPGRAKPESSFPGFIAEVTNERIVLMQVLLRASDYFAAEPKYGVYDADLPDDVFEFISRIDTQGKNAVIPRVFKSAFAHAPLDRYLLSLIPDSDILTLHPVHDYT